MIEEGRPGALIKTTDSPNKQLYDDMSDFIKQLDFGTPKKSTPVKEAKAIAQNGASTRIQNAIRGKLAKNKLLDTYNIKTPAAQKIQKAYRSPYQDEDHWFA